MAERVDESFISLAPAHSGWHAMVDESPNTDAENWGYYPVACWAVLQGDGDGETRVVGMVAHPLSVGGILLVAEDLDGFVGYRTPK